MRTVKIDKRRGETLSDYIEEGEEVVSSEYAAGIETVELQEHTADYVCDECDKEFETRQGLAGHANAHK